MTHGFCGIYLALQQCNVSLRSKRGMSDRKFKGKDMTQEAREGGAIGSKAFTNVFFVVTYRLTSP